MTRKIGELNIVRASESEALLLMVDAVMSLSVNVFAFCNAHTVNLSRKRPDFLASLNRAVVFNDGIGIDLASRALYGKPFPANLNGTDLTPKLLEALPAGTSVFLIGSRGDIAERARTNLANKFPLIRFVGAHDGYFTPYQNQSIIDDIRQSEAKLVLVGMGQPLQELWATDNASKIQATLVCIGAFLDFSAGAIPRAPAWIRSARMEWMFRFAQEPRRLAKRYLLGNFTFIVYIISLAFGKISSTK